MALLSFKHFNPYQCGSWLSLIGKVGYRVAPPSPQSSSYLSFLGSAQGGSVGMLMYQSILYFTLEKPVPLRTLELNAFNHHWTYQMDLCVFSHTGSPNSVQVSGRNCHRSIQTSYSAGTCWMEAPWHPKVFSMLADVHHQFPITKDLTVDVAWLAGQIYATAAFNILAAQRCVLDRHGFSSSICQASTTQVNQQS